MHVKRGRLLLLTPGPVLFWSCICVCVARQVIFLFLHKHKNLHLVNMQWNVYPKPKQYVYRMTIQIEQIPKKTRLDITFSIIQLHNNAYWFLWNHKNNAIQFQNILSQMPILCSPVSYDISSHHPIIPNAACLLQLPWIPCLTLNDAYLFIARFVQKFQYQEISSS